MIKYILIFVPALWLMMVSCSNPSITKQTTYSQQIKDSLTTELTEVLKQGHFNGFAVAIVNDTGTLFEKGFGFADVALQKRYTKHTIQNIASVSKTLVGVALLKAQELGMLKLDDDINLYLPFKVVNPKFPKNVMTLRHLATHTSGIIDNEYYFSKNYYLKPCQDLSGLSLIFDGTQVFNPYDSAVEMKTFLENTLTPKGKWFQKDGFTSKKPGELYEYSNTGTTLAAYIIECATGVPFDEFTKRYILQPLHMNASGWKFEGVDFLNYARLYENPKKPLPFYSMATYPDGNFITSAGDLSKYLTELIKGYNGRGTILNKENYAELFKPQLLSTHFTDRNENNPYSESYNVGIFMGFGYTGYIGHTGGDPGVLSMLFFNPETNTGRIMIFNTAFSDKAGNDAFYKAWNILEKYQSKLTNN